MTTTIAIACPYCHLRFVHRVELLAHLREDHPAPIADAPAPVGRMVVPVDPDEPPPAALSLATSLADQADLALDVIAAPGLGGPLSTAAYLRTNVGRLADLDALRRAWHVLAGEPGVAIVDHVARTSPDLVCMGTRGHRGAGELLLGSIAHRVVGAGKVPVLLVGPKVHDLPERIRRIVVGIDGSDRSRLALAVADRLRHVLGAELLLVEVLDPTYPTPGDCIESGEVLRVAHDLDEPVNWDVLHGPRPADAIVDYTRAMTDTLLVVGTHGRTGMRSVLLGSVAQDIVAKASQPTLVVPPATDVASFLA